MKNVFKIKYKTWGFRIESPNQKRQTCYHFNAFDVTQVSQFKRFSLISISGIQRRCSSAGYPM